jgi:hypothetical protein
VLGNDKFSGFAFDFSVDLIETFHVVKFYTTKLCYVNFMDGKKFKFVSTLPLITGFEIRENTTFA